MAESIVEIQHRKFFVYTGWLMVGAGALFAITGWSFLKAGRNPRLGR